jgi:hypothetical protein
MVLRAAFLLKGGRQLRIKKEKPYEKNCCCSVSLLVRHAAGFSNR